MDLISNIMAHACNPKIEEVEAGKPEIQGHPWLYEKLRLAWATWDPEFKRKHVADARWKMQTKV